MHFNEAVACLLGKDWLSFYVALSRTHSHEHDSTEVLRAWTVSVPREWELGMDLDLWARSLGNTVTAQTVRRAPP